MTPPTEPGQPEATKADTTKFFGILKREGQRTLSIEEMNEIIRKGWAGELD